VKAEADRHAANILPVIREAQKAGANTLRAVAAALNARSMPTARGLAPDVREEHARPLDRTVGSTQYGPSNRVSDDGGRNDSCIT
jgi:hypothetical protein